MACSPRVCSLKRKDPAVVAGSVLLSVSVEDSSQCCARNLSAGRHDGVLGDALEIADAKRQQDGVREVAVYLSNARLVPQDPDEVVEHIAGFGVGELEKPCVEDLEVSERTTVVPVGA